MHPMLRLLSTQPQLLADHAAAYAALVSAEVDCVGAEWKRRTLLGAVALCCIGVAAVLAGVALMLWAVMPPAQVQAPWALVLAPLVPAVAALGCVLMAQVRPDGRAFDNVRQQVRADLLMLRELSA